MTTAIDWDELRCSARQMAARAYAPYSGVHVGTAGLTDDGRIVLGSNVENASYGLTLCAECSLVSHLVGTRGTRLVAVCTVAGDGEPIAPCGRCRQVLFEFGGAELLVDTNAGPVTLGELLPWAFGPEDVVTRRNEP
jgi:cytidine deaminase